MKGRTTGCAVAGIAIIVALVFLGRHVLRQTPTEPTTAQTEPAKPEPLRRARPSSHHAELPAETSVSQPEELAVTNAATLYRQAFALYDALSKDEKGLLNDWRTNVDASVEAKLCEKVRPICELMHWAILLTNCDWGIGPITPETTLPHLAMARNAARATVWSASHCRPAKPDEATADVLSALKLGHNVSTSALTLGCFVHVAIQNIALDCIAAQMEKFRGPEVASELNGPNYQKAPAIAMEQEAQYVDGIREKFAAMSDAEAQAASTNYVILWSSMGEEVVFNRAQFLHQLQQVVKMQRDLVGILDSSSEEDFQSWCSRRDALLKSNEVSRGFLPTAEPYLKRVESLAIKRQMVIAGIKVVQHGTAALQSYADPATGQPFIYTETPDGFELQSGYQTNGIPLKMQFK